MIRHGGLFDSITEPSLFKMVTSDSTEIIEVSHKICNGYHVEFLTYIDHRVEGNLKKLKYIKSLIAKPMGNADCNIDDTIGYINNPYKDLNGIYIAVFRYKGRIVYSGGMDGGGWPDKVLMENIIYSFGDMGWCQHYVSVKNEDNNVIKYNLTKDEVLEIKPIDAKKGLQLWKWDKGKYYELRVLLDKGLNLPTINFWNNLGEAACGNDSIMEPPFFDKINYDSLMNSK